MADMETSWESSECRGDGGVKGGSEVGGESLPPRKRLLAGLRQNSWLASSSPLVSPGAGELLQGIGLEEEDDEEVEGVDGECRGDMIVGEEREEDEEFMVSCCRCGRSLHPECDDKRKPLAEIDSSSYFCRDCLSTATRHKASMNGSSGSRSKGCSGSTVEVNCSTIETGMVSSGAEFSSSFGFKKPRMSREWPKLEDADHADPSQSEGLVSGREPSQGILVSVSSHDAAAAADAAKSAAAHAIKVAMAAKENAAAKASIAVKAAAAAKVALEAAADAARAVAHVRAELRRQPGLSESSSKLQIFVAPESPRERIFERTEVKVEKTEEKQAGHSGGAAAAVSLDDEQLTQQLHRVMNSSPCISHSLTPPQMKTPGIPDSASSGVSISSTDVAWPQNIQTSPTELLSQAKPQQTRPQSVMHKDLKRFDGRVVSHEAKKIMEIHESEYLSPKLSSKPSELPASEEISSVMKAEAVEGVVAFSTREDSFTTAAGCPEELVEDLLTTAAEHSAEFPFDVMMAITEAGDAHLICDGHERRPDLLQEILEAAILADSAMSLDEGSDAFIPEDACRAEYNEGSVQQEGHGAFSDLLAEAKEDESRTDAIVVDVMPSTTQTPIAAGNAGDGSAVVEMAHASRDWEDFGAAEMVDDGDMASKHSGVAEVVHAYDAEIAVEDSGASEVLCTDNADMVLNDSEALVIHADGADTALGDSGAAETLHSGGAP